MGERQKQLLKLLRGSKPGLSVDELSKGLEITRNAVRQHLASLAEAGLVSAGATRPSGGDVHSSSIFLPSKVKRCLRVSIHGLPSW